MNQKHFQTYMLTRILVRNEFGTLRALVRAIEKASAIPEDTNWRDRKDAFNAIAAKAPLRNDVDTYCVIHADIPTFLEREWSEFNTFQSMIRGRKGPDYENAVSRFWQVE